MTGIVFDIKRYAVHDGPGIRTTVFFKGCPLRCVWCHNPESFSKSIECIKRQHYFDGQVIEKTEMIGREYSIPELMDEITKDQLYYEQSGGGITFSGGEPLFQSDFLQAALIACKEHSLHTSVDTSGFCSEESLKKILPYTDLFLFDIKQLNDIKHKEYTNVSNKSILENLAFLIQEGKEVIVRYPLIPNYNMDDIHFKALEELINKYRHAIKELHILPFHAIANGKYERFNIPNKLHDLKSLSKKEVISVIHQFSHLGIPVKIGG